MYHSIYFGEKNTWDDWKLVPAEFPRFKPPEAKTSIIEIPGADGSLDLTESLTGDVKFKNRTGSLTFYAYDEGREWYNYYFDMINYLHGQEMRVVLEDDPIYYWIGRFSVNEWKSNPPTNIVVDYNVHPYKYEDTDSSYRWEWDPHNFNTELCRDHGHFYEIDGTRIVRMQGSKLKSSPVFTAYIEDGDTLSLCHDGVLYPLVDGTNKFLSITPDMGISVFIFSGKGQISIAYTGGYL